MTRLGKKGRIRRQESAAERLDDGPPSPKVRLQKMQERGFGSCPDAIKLREAIARAAS